MRLKSMPIPRRTWLQSIAALALLAAGCGHRGQTGAEGNQLKVFNWSDYIDDGVVPEFERRTGCTVVYDNYSSDSELETRLATGAGSYDVVFPSDRAMAALVAKGLLRELDHSRLPNIRHLDRKFLAPPFDPTNRFSVPYFWGTLAVGIRTDFIPDAAEGLEPLFDERNRGRITMLDDMENVVAVVLGHLGYPLNSVDPDHLKLVQQKLLVQRPLVQAYTSDSYRERLITGEAWASLGWSGDLLQANSELQKSHPSGRVKVIVPQGGTMLWIDSMVIPRAAQNVELAHAFINYLLEPSVAVLNAQKVNYATPNATARDQLPAAMLADESIYPPAEVLARCTALKDRGPDIEKIERVWRVVRQ
jgi:spermidine/putrescine transport system substrate-binding protein